MSRSIAARKRSRPPTWAVVASLFWLAGCQVSKRVGPTGVLHPSPLPPPVAAVSVPVRVALAENTTTAQAVSCTGPWRLSVGPRAGFTLDLAAGEKLTVHAQADGRIACDSIPASVSYEHLLLAPVVPGHTLIWDGRPWRGALLIAPGAAGGARLTVINLVELESYLAGVVPLEMGRGRAPAELAALTAQAVVARTYAAASLGKRSPRGFDLQADTRDQVYGGVAAEDSLCNVAVALSAGLVLRRGPGQALADAFYHSTCGGHTAASAAVWPVAPDLLLGGVGDRRQDGRPWCADSRYFAWREQWSWPVLQRVLANTLPAYLDYVAQPARAAWAADAFTPAKAGADGRRPGALLDLQVKGRTAEGRVAVLEITTDAGRYRVRGDQTRRVLQPASGSPQLLRSAWFSLEVSRGREVTAAGRGWGHGIGLCQTGALARARAGQDTAAILAHYYPGAVIAPLAAEVLP